MASFCPVVGLILVTDAVSALGLKDGVHHIGELEIEVKNNCAHILGTNTLCGSILPLNKCVRLFDKFTGTFAFLKGWIGGVFGMENFSHNFDKFPLDLQRLPRRYFSGFFLKKSPSTSPITYQDFQKKIFLRFHKFSLKLLLLP